MLFNPQIYIETDISIYMHYIDEKKYDWKQDLTNLLITFPYQVNYLPQFKRFKILNFCLNSSYGSFFMLKIDLNWNDMNHIENSVMFKTKVMCHDILKLQKKLKKKKR